MGDLGKHLCMGIFCDDAVDDNDIKYHVLHII